MRKVLNVAGMVMRGILGETGSEDIGIQVAPLWIGGFDELELPCAAPLLDRLLATDRRVHRIMALEPHERVQTVATREALHHARSMLLDATYKIGRHAGIERAVAIARED